MIDDPVTQAGLSRIFPLIPDSIRRMQSEIGPLLLADLNPGVKAAIVNNLVMAQGVRLFADDPDIHVATSRGLRYFALRGAVVRIKLAERRRLNISLNQTVQTMEWTQQTVLDGFTDPRDRLHLVDVPDVLWTTVARSVVGVYHGAEIRDCREIDIDGWFEDGGAAVDPFSPQSQPTRPQIRLKAGVATMPLEVVDGTT